MYHLLPLIIKSSRTTKNHSSSSEKALTPQELRLFQEAGHIDKDWFEDGIRITKNSEFRRTLVPNRFVKSGFEAELAAALAKQHGMKNPKPEFMYGIRTDKYAIPAGVIVSPKTTALLEIAVGLHSPFLIVEGKSDNGSMAEAENQACRGGATLVNASRELLKMIGDVEAPGADNRTFVFSCTMSPKLVQVWVHWAEINDKQDCDFHMNLVASKSLDDEDSLVQSRRILHNILDWGCVSRSIQLQDFYEKLYRYEREHLTKLREASPKKRKLNADTLKSTSISDADRS